MADEAGGGQPNNMYMTIGVVVVLIIVVAVAAFILMRPVATEAPAPSNMQQTTPTALPSASASALPSISPSAAASPVAGQVKAFTVAASNYKFTPSELRVKQGDTVKITLTNGSPMPHDWRLDEFAAKTKVITNGQTDTVEFVANKIGSFEYYCSVGNHRQMGMVGKLIVE